MVREQPRESQLRCKSITRRLPSGAPAPQTKILLCPLLDVLSRTPGAIRRNRRDREQSERRPIVHQHDRTPHHNHHMR